MPTQEEFDALVAEYNGLKDNYHTLQVKLDAEIQSHADTRAGVDKIKADGQQALTDLAAQHAATVQKLQADNAAAMQKLQTDNAAALLQQKQRVDRMEFEARQAAELAALKG